MLVVVTILVGGGPWVIREAHCIGPVIQVVEIAHNHDDTRDANGSVHGSGLRGHRLPGRLHGDKYLQDLAAVMNDLRGRYPNLPLWAVGTSQGTISAAVAAANVSPPPDGIVLLLLSQDLAPWETCRALTWSR
jgi:hypothetical protein